MKEQYEPAQSGSMQQLHDYSRRLYQNRSTRKKDLEASIRSPKSLINIDGLLDSITALVLDCEPMKKNKNIDNFLSRCKIIALLLLTMTNIFILFFYSSLIS
jgi:hypothetical protein